MTSEAFPAPDAIQEPGEPGDQAGTSPAAQGGGPAQGGGLDQDRGPDQDRGLNLTDPKAIRALAHPVRWALLEALGQAGTLTATQASEMLGESPANCAFHLRTLAKYGFVEEAGGGKGRERPWRQTYDRVSWRSRVDDPQASQAAEALDQVWLERSMGRARHSLTSTTRWPEGLENALGATTTRLYVTAEEADQLYTEIQQAFQRFLGPQNRFRDRRDPKLRPADAIPVEFVLMGYPVLDLPPLPEGGEGSEAGADGPDSPD
jgi:predicted transcriptional regulator